jgi:hypothetical protein
MTDAAQKPATKREKRAVKWAAQKKAKPSLIERATAEPRRCPNCSTAIVRAPGQRGPAQTFCKPTAERNCAKEYHNREITEGRAVIALLKAWRVDRGAGEIASTCLREVCSIVDSFNAADLKADRMRADYYAAIKLHDGLRYMDRRQG